MISIYLSARAADPAVSPAAVHAAVEVAVAEELLGVAGRPGEEIRASARDLLGTDEALAA